MIIACDLYVRATLRGMKIFTTH